MTHPPLILPEPCLQSGVEEYREIPLTQGLVRIVDERDWEYLMQWKWCSPRQRNTHYALRSIRDRTTLKTKFIYMHREVLEIHKVPFELVDHINRNGLDNRLINLRSTTVQLNSMNTGLNPTNTSGYKGVSFWKQKRKYRARIRIGARQMRYLGCFNTPQEAALAYNRAAVELYGDYAWLNPLTEAQE